jgi:hypothetical protein
MNCTNPDCIAMAEKLRRVEDELARERARGAGYKFAYEEVIKEKAALVESMKLENDE